ncbi:uncharacterized protein LOC62_06G008362 [Vanrija pseudolonga]|uniref:DUF3224 domain-containing protein n=1 Tax=Vanrija pseudolonga TaxID=143232 RepID=A0AAF0YHR5_9TREE|nr:hypothetical protein LOC62_06G008362 [Vanrija pseudolonga]
MAPSTITSSFKVLSYTETPVPASRDVPVKTNFCNQEREYHGAQISGWAVGVYIKTYQSDDANTFVGQQVFTGTLLGRQGTFTALAKGAFADGVVTAEWQIISGTGELAGISGSGTYGVPAGYKSGDELPFELHVEFA